MNEVTRQKLLSEQWRKSRLVPSWWVSNLGRVRQGHPWGTKPLTPRWSFSMGDWVVEHRSEREYVRIRDLYEDTWGIPPVHWEPLLNLTVTYQAGRNFNNVYCRETGESYRTLDDATYHLGVSRSSIIRALNGDGKVAGGRYTIERAPKEGRLR